ncbi:helix-turn-helix domain-containing protein [Xanthomonas hortorum]
MGGKVEQAALRLGIPRSTLYQKIKMHGIGAASHDTG